MQRDVVAALHHARAAGLAEQPLGRDRDVEMRVGLMRMQRREQPGAAGAEDQNVGLQMVHGRGLSGHERFRRIAGQCLHHIAGLAGGNWAGGWRERRGWFFARTFACRDCTRPVSARAYEAFELRSKRGQPRTPLAGHPPDRPLYFSEEKRPSANSQTT